MKKYFLQALFLVFCLFIITNNRIIAQDTNKKTVYKLTHHMTPEEWLRKDEIGKDFYPTDPPQGPVRQTAEFEKMQGVLIRYPFGISFSIIAEMSEDIMVTTVVTNQSQEDIVRGYYNANGVNLDSCNFIHAPSDSYWIRDYGPWFVFDGNNEPGIVNFPYNRPRPDDNDIPIEMANFLGIELYGMDIIHTGGNYMTDGMGISASTELVWDENPSLTHLQIDEMVEDYLGITTYHVVPDPNNTYIDHIDCWGKFLDVDKILIRSVPESHPQYDDIEATAAYFAAQTSSYGVPYEVYRVYTPDNQPYTNSLILNNKVLVPIMGCEWDDDALASYEEAMPGYEVLGLTGTWEST
ncbi:MAG: agmatine deiminase family protein, partial [Bacteroidales bacterium]|nr:agmatine deiminase family protein [Bacteroidales bacterium]